MLQVIVTSPLSKSGYTTVKCATRREAIAFINRLKSVVVKDGTNVSYIKRLPHQYTVYAKRMA